MGSTPFQPKAESSGSRASAFPVTTWLCTAMASHQPLLGHGKMGSPGPLQPCLRRAAGCTATMSMHEDSLSSKEGAPNCRSSLGFEHPFPHLLDAKQHLSGLPFPHFLHGDHTPTSLSHYGPRQMTKAWKRRACHSQRAHLSPSSCLTASFLSLHHVLASCPCSALIATDSAFI